MTTLPMTLVERLRGRESQDHRRHCPGRDYNCSCGFEREGDELCKDAADRIEQLEEQIQELKYEIEGLRIQRGYE